MAAVALCWLTPAVTAAHADAGVGTALTADRYGALLGSDTAAVRLEIFCEPQCPICKGFEAASGDQLVRGLAGHRLAVTYRWLTFLDNRRHSDTSARTANALMLAADPTVAPVAYQNFVGELYRQQGGAGDGPTAAQIADMARSSGLPAPVADRIAAGEPAVDTAAMNEANHQLLTQANPEKPGTPTVYNLTTGSLVDTEEPGWLDRLTAAG